MKHKWIPIRVLVIVNLYKKILLKMKFCPVAYVFTNERSSFLIPKSEKRVERVKKSERGAL